VFTEPFLRNGSLFANCIAAAVLFVCVGVFAKQWVYTPKYFISKHMWTVIFQKLMPAVWVLNADGGEK
jgi:hypothetical protein